MPNVYDWPGAEYLKFLVLKDSMLSSEPRKAICKELGLGRTTLYSRLEDTGQWKLQELVPLAQYLRMSIEEIVILLCNGPRGTPYEE